MPEDTPAGKAVLSALMGAGVTAAGSIVIYLTMVLFRVGEGFDFLVLGIAWAIYAIYRIISGIIDVVRQKDRIRGLKSIGFGLGALPVIPAVLLFFPFI